MNLTSVPNFSGPYLFNIYLPITQASCTSCTRLPFGKVEWKGKVEGSHGYFKDHELETADRQVKLLLSILMPIYLLPKFNAWMLAATSPSHPPPRNPSFTFRPLQPSIHVQSVAFDALAEPSPLCNTHLLRTMVANESTRAHRLSARTDLLQMRL